MVIFIMSGDTTFQKDYVGFTFQYGYIYYVETGFLLLAHNNYLHSNMVIFIMR